MPRLTFDPHFCMPPKSLRKIKRPKALFFPFKMLTMQNNIICVNISPCIAEDGIQDFPINSGGLDRTYSGMDTNYA